MKLRINESIDKNLFIQEINNINNSNESNIIKISKIIRILDKLDIGYVIDLAPNQNSAITHFTKINSYKWEDYPYTYGTYDIANEIVNGRLNKVIDIWNIDKAKSVMSKKKSDDIFLKCSGWNV